MKIDFYHVDAFETANYEPIWRALRARGVDARMVAVPGAANRAPSGWFDFDCATDYFRARGIPFVTAPDPSAVGVTTQNGSTLEDYPAPRLRLMYGPNVYPPSWGLSHAAAAPFDGILVHGAAYQRHLAQWKRADQLPIIGYPRYDDLFTGRLDPQQAPRAAKLDPKKSILFHLPTWAENSSLERFFGAIDALQARFNVVVKPHHCTVRREPERMKLLRASGVHLATDTFDLLLWLAAADVVLADARSCALTEALAAGKKVIGLAHDPAEIDQWIAPSGLMEHVSFPVTPQELTEAVHRRMERPGQSDAWQRWADDHVAFRDGSAADRAAEAVIQLVEQQARTATPSASSAIGSAENRWLQRLQHPRRTLRNALRRLAPASASPASPAAPPEVNLSEKIHAALRWIDHNTIPGQGIRVTHTRPHAYPEVTGYFIPSLLNWGEHARAVAYARWLISIQNRDGSWSDAEGKSPYTFDTGQILKGLIAILPRLPSAEESIRRGCDWLLTQIEPSGRVTTPDKSQWGLPGGRTISENIHLYALEPLRDAGQRWNEPRYGEAVDRALRHYLAKPDLTDFNTLSHFHAYVMEALIDLGARDACLRGMAGIGQRQRGNGSVPAYADVDWVCSTGLAQYAITWFKLGHREPGARAFEHFCRLQNDSGGFFGGYGEGASYFPHEEISWAVKYLLDASFWHVRTTFDSQVNSGIIHDEIAEQDGRMQAVLAGLGDLAGQRVLDAGCGKGRFARVLRQKYPDAVLAGVDLSDGMLRQVPAGMEAHQGSLLNLPFANDAFDRVFSVETLEHCVNPEVAVAELCRVTKPGGRIVIVDKNVERQGALQIEAWERWFSREEVSAWLSGHCTDVQAKFVSYGNRAEPDGLFVAWQGTRR